MVIRNRSLTGVVTFKPNKDFTGTPDPAKVTAKDTNGTKVETTYTPTVTPVVPTAEPKRKQKMYKVQLKHQHVAFNALRSKETMILIKIMLLIRQLNHKLLNLTEH